MDKINQSGLAHNLVRWVSFCLVWGFQSIFSIPLLLLYFLNKYIIIYPLKKAQRIGHLDPLNIPVISHGWACMMTWAVHNFDSIKILNAITSLHTRRNRSRRVGPLSVYQTYTLPMMSSVSLVQFPYGYGYHIMDSYINYYKQMRVRKKKKLHFLKFPSLFPHMVGWKKAKWVEILSS